MDWLLATRKQPTITRRHPPVITPRRHIPCRVPGDLLKENSWNDYRPFEGLDYNFFGVFGVFFPAVTGIVAGANLSGDLKVRLT